MRKKDHIIPGTLHKSGEDYLEAILMLHMQKGCVRSVDIADFLAYSRPSVSNAVAVLSQAGYLTMDNEHLIHLTEQGQKIAESVYERHCFFKDLLVRAGVDEKSAEDNACRMEHAITPEAFRLLKNMLQPEPQE